MKIYRRISHNWDKEQVRILRLFNIEVKDSVMLRELLYSISKLVGVTNAYRVEKNVAPKDKESKKGKKKGSDKKAKKK